MLSSKLNIVPLSLHNAGLPTQNLPIIFVEGAAKMYLQIDLFLTLYIAVSTLQLQDFAANTQLWISGFNSDG